MHPERRDVAIVYCTYNPPQSWVGCCRRLASAYPVVVIDDGSREEYRSALRGVADDVRLIEKDRNAGIADSVNRGIAECREYSWVLFADQDSEFDPSLVGALLEAADQFKHGHGRFPGAIGPGCIGDLSYRASRSVGRFLSVPEIIQSGALFRVSALLEIGGVDPAYVIDGVDTLLCLSLRSRGWAVVAVGDLSMGHRIGSGRVLRILGHTVLIADHTPMRVYYITRNRLVLLRRFARREPAWALTTARRMVVALITMVMFGENRGAKLRAVLHGLHDFATRRMGKV